MKIIYFDLCAIAIYLVMIWTCVSRRLTKGRGNRAFLFMSAENRRCFVVESCSMSPLAGMLQNCI